MPMGIVSDEEFNSELGKTNPGNSNPTITGVIQDVNRGRGKGNIEVPNVLRNIIGDESTTNGRQSAIELAKSFGISPSSVSAYNAGATSTATYETKPNESIILNAKERVAKRARGKLMRALNKITDDKLDSANARDLAGIAKDMSAIVRSMEPEVAKASTNNSGPTYVFYAPHMRKEEEYDVIHVKE